MILIRSATLDRLRQDAQAAAAAEGLAPDDIVYGTFAAEHVSRALEDAYGACPHADESVPPGDSELVFTAISLAAGLAGELRSLADAEADRQGVSAAEDDREDFASSYIGRRLDDSFRQRG